MLHGSPESLKQVLVDGEFVKRDGVVNVTAEANRLLHPIAQQYTTTQDGSPQNPHIIAKGLAATVHTYGAFTVLSFERYLADFEYSQGDVYETSVSRERLK